MAVVSLSMGCVQQTGKQHDGAPRGPAAIQHSREACVLCKGAHVPGVVGCVGPDMLSFKDCCTCCWRQVPSLLYGLALCYHSCPCGGCCSCVTVQ